MWAVIEGEKRVKIKKKFHREYSPENWARLSAKADILPIALLIAALTIHFSRFPHLIQIDAVIFLILLTFEWLWC